MSGFLVLQEFGANVVAESLRDNVKSFQKQQVPTLRKAARVLQRDIVRRVHMRFGVWRPRGTGKERLIGPLFEKVQSKVKRTNKDVFAIIGPSRRAFYGRFLETGINTTALRHNRASRAADQQAREAGIFRKRKLRQYVQSIKTSYQVNIKPRPYIEPALRANLNKVVEIVGESYAVFYGGSRA